MGPPAVLLVLLVPPLGAVARSQGVAQLVVPQLMRAVIVDCPAGFCS